MNGDGDSVLNSHICFNALATLQHLKNVENSCSFCSASDHSTYICPVLSQGEHVKDTSIQNMSRSSVPHGLQVFENESGPHIISGQKFAKGCRFGPLLAPKSYIPIANTKFPLTIFGNVNLDMDGINMPELKELFKVRNIYLDTRNENHCNWMIHVDPATCLNEQNLVAYEEDNEIFFAAIEDLDVGDILKVWYAPKYAERMNAEPLRWSPHQVVTNILNMGGGVNLPDFQFLNTSQPNETQSNRTEISLPPIKSIIKPSSYVCYENRTFTPVTGLPLMPSPQTLTQNLTMSAEASFEERHEDAFYMNQILDLDLTNVLSDSALSMNPAFIKAATPFANDVDDDIADVVQDLVSANSGSSLSSDKEEKKIYPCQLCDKKYSTMTNIYRHVRTQHNYFLCSLCMNMFKLENDLKEHIHKCPKSDVKKPQCSVCMQYFSNSWSLTRHVKIHVTAGECDADVLVDKRNKDKKIKSEVKDSIDLSDIEKNSRDSLATESSNLALEYPSTAPSLCDFETDNGLELTELPPIQKSESNTSIDQCGTENEISACIVCEKRFKSKSYMNKHLRSVHTVKVMSASKRPASSTSTTKSSATPTKRSLASEINPALTVTGAPVNPLTAKALASKLSERSNQMMNKPSASANLAPTLVPKNIPVPPLISIQTTAVQRTSEIESSMQTGDIDAQSIPMAPPNTYSNHDFETDLNVPTFNIMKKSSMGSNGIDDSGFDLTPFQNTSSNDDLTKEVPPVYKMHKCDSCGKKFNKKYELKRHKAVHENITYTCPYCTKVVKRKPSITKHLRIAHKEMEHMWNQTNFVENLKKYVDIDNDDMSTSPLLAATSPTSLDDATTNPKVVLLTRDNIATPDPLTASRVVAKRKYLLNNNILPKPKKSLATLKGHEHDKLKKPSNKSQNKMADPFKKSLKLNGKMAKQNDSMGTYGVTELSQNVTKTALNQNFTICSSSSSSSPTSNSTMSNGANGHMQRLASQSNIIVPYEYEDPNIKNLQPRLDLNQKANSVSNVVALLSSPSDVLMGQPQAVNSNPTPNADYVNIIDNCFFVDDTLNCNVLHSPFSSDNDVDGFIIANSNEGSASNKELLNKFHDRLEEMEEKIDNAEYKLYWNGESDEDNEDDAIHGGDDDDEVNDGQDDASAEFAGLIASKAQFNEFV